MLKPKARQASLGVFKVNDERQLLEAFPATLQESTDGKILIEEFIDGIEVTVEAFSLAGECRALAVSEKTHYDFNPCIASRLAYPPRMAECTILAIKRTAESVVQRLGLKDGISHAEYRVRAGVPYLVEVGARGGGNSIASTIIPHVSGVDVYELLIRRLQGLDAQFPQIENRSALLQFFDFQPGRVKAVEGLDVVRRDKLAQEIELYFGPGDVLAEASSDRSRPGYFIVLGDTRDETDEAARRVLELVKVGYE